MSQSLSPVAPRGRRCCLSKILPLVPGLNPDRSKSTSTAISSTAISSSTTTTTTTMIPPPPPRPNSPSAPSRDKRLPERPLPTPTKDLPPLPPSRSRQSLERKPVGAHELSRSPRSRPLPSLPVGHAPRKTQAIISRKPVASHSLQLPLPTVHRVLRKPVSTGSISSVPSTYTRGSLETQATQATQAYSSQESIPPSLRELDDEAFNKEAAATCADGRRSGGHGGDKCPHVPVDSYAQLNAATPPAKVTTCDGGSRPIHPGIHPGPGLYTLTATATAMTTDADLTVPAPTAATTDGIGIAAAAAAAVFFTATASAVSGTRGISPQCQSRVRQENSPSPPIIEDDGRRKLASSWPTTRTPQPTATTHTASETTTTASQTCPGLVARKSSPAAVHSSAFPSLSPFPEIRQRRLLRVIDLSRPTATEFLLDRVYGYRRASAVRATAQPAIEASRAGSDPSGGSIRPVPAQNNMGSETSKLRSIKHRLALSQRPGSALSAPAANGNASSKPPITATQRPPTPEYPGDDDDAAKPVINGYAPPLSPASSPETLKASSPDFSKETLGQVEHGRIVSSTAPPQLSSVGPLPPKPSKASRLRIRTITSNPAIRSAPLCVSSPTPSLASEKATLRPPSASDAASQRTIRLAPRANGNGTPKGPRSVSSPGPPSACASPRSVGWRDIKAGSEAHQRAAFFSESPPEGIVRSLPPTSTHFACYQRHKTMMRRGNKNYPLTCQMCGRADTEDRWACVFCHVQMCASCVRKLDGHQRDLGRLADELANGTKAGDRFT